MTHGEFSIFLFGTIIMCCVMSVFNVLKNGRRGWPSYILSVAFLEFAGTVYLYFAGASPILINGGTALLILLLAADFCFRAGTTQKGKKR